MKYVRKRHKGKKYIQLTEVTSAPTSKLSAFLEKISIEYIRLMYNIQLVKLEGYWMMPDNSTSKADWIRRKIEKIQEKIIERLKEEIK